MASLVSSVIIIIPPYLSFEFYELLTTILKGREKDSPFQFARLTKERGYLLAKPFEHVGDDPYILQPFPLGPLFQHLVLSDTQRFQEQVRVIHHLIPNAAATLLIMPEEFRHIPGGEGYLPYALRKDCAVLRYCARNGSDHSRCRPGGDDPLPDEIHEVGSKSTIESQSGGDPPLGAPNHGGYFLLR